MERGIMGGEGVIHHIHPSVPIRTYRVLVRGFLRSHRVFCLFFILLLVVTHQLTPPPCGISVHGPNVQNANTIQQWYKGVALAPRWGVSKPLASNVH